MQVTADASVAPRAKSESVMHALMSIGRLMQRRSDDTLDIGTFWLLKTVGTSGTIRVTDLAAYCNLDISTVSRHLAQLHKTGMIERAPDPVDRRAQRAAEQRRTGRVDRGPSGAASALGTQSGELGAE